MVEDLCRIFLKVFHRALGFAIVFSNNHGIVSPF